MTTPPYSMTTPLMGGRRCEEAGAIGAVHVPYRGGGDYSMTTPLMGDRRCEEAEADLRILRRAGEASRIEEEVRPA